MTASELAAAAVLELPLAVMSLGVIVSNHRLASKVIDAMGDRTRVVAPQAAPREQQAARRVQGHQRDARGRFASKDSAERLREVS